MAETKANPLTTRDFSRVVLTLENVLIPEDKLSPTPSMQDGLDSETEIDLRIVGCELIQTSGILLKMPQVWPFSFYSIGPICHCIFLCFTTTKWICKICYVTISQSLCFLSLFFRLQWLRGRSYFRGFIIRNHSWSTIWRWVETGSPLCNM